MRASPVMAMVLLVLSAVLAGCVDLAVFPAEIPAAALAPGWAVDSERTQDGTVGAEPVVRAHYHVSAYRDQGAASLTDPQGPGAAIVVSVPDAPLVDEQAEIQKRVAALVADSGITVQPRSIEPTSGSGTVAGQAVTYQLFEARIGSANGIGIDIAYKCAGNGQHVRVYGYAVTEATVLGTTRTSLVTWRELAGEAETGSLGGMVTLVKCS